MAREKKQYPTEKELAILKILWAGGPSTVRQVNEQISKQQKTGYTTTLKLMQIMTDKGLLTRDDTPFKHIYKPAVSKEKTEKQIVADMLDKVFAGSAENWLCGPSRPNRSRQRSLKKSVNCSIRWRNNHGHTDTIFIRTNRPADRLGSGAFPVAGLRGNGIDGARIEAARQGILKHALFNCLFRTCADGIGANCNLYINEQS